MLLTTYSDQAGLVSPLAAQEEEKEEEELEMNQTLLREREFLMMGLQGCKEERSDYNFYNNEMIIKKFIWYSNPYSYFIEL